MRNCISDVWTTAYRRMPGWCILPSYGIMLMRASQVLPEDPHEPIPTSLAAPRIPALKLPEEWL